MFLILYKFKEVVDENIKKVKSSLEELYNKHVILYLEESSYLIVSLEFPTPTCVCPRLGKESVLAN